jgi:hypothetical protein
LTFSPVEGLATVIKVSPAGNPKLISTKVDLLINEEYQAEEYANNMALMLIDPPLVPDESELLLNEIYCLLNK